MVEGILSAWGSVFMGGVDTNFNFSSCLLKGLASISRDWCIVREWCWCGDTRGQNRICVLKTIGTPSDRDVSRAIRTYTVSVFWCFVEQSDIASDTACLGLVHQLQLRSVHILPVPCLHRRSAPERQHHPPCRANTTFHQNTALGTCLHCLYLSLYNCALRQ